MTQFDIRFLETPEELKAIEDLQRIIWPGNDIEILPVHIFRAVIHNGGLILGAFSDKKLVGFVFGFPGYERKANQKVFYHASHMAGVHPEFRNSGIGTKLKRAQWQMVRRQGVQRITWTYDPLQSRNANLNISKLGAVCNTYIPNFYGVMRDELNFGMPSDRFQVDWWINSNRVKRRLASRKSFRLDPSQYLDAGIPLANQTTLHESGFLSPRPARAIPGNPVMLLLEIPTDIHAMKQSNMQLAVSWSDHIRALFLDLFNRGYLATDFIYDRGEPPRSFYLLTYGEATF